MKVLLSIDNSEHSRYAVTDTAESRWPAGSDLIVATSVASPFGFKPPATIPESAQHFVEETAALIRAQNPDFKSIETKVLLGNPKSEILGLLEQSNSDMLMLGSRKPDFNKMLFGSVSHALLLATECSVRISREKKSHHGKRVVIALDSSEFSRRALEEVVARPWPEQTEFICVNAVPTLAESFYQAPDVFSVEELEKGRRELMNIANNELTKATELLLSNVPKCTARYDILHGDPRPEVVRASEEFDADLIVLGSQGRNFAARIAVGSVSEAVAVSASCSVEIIKRRSK